MKKFITILKIDEFDENSLAQVKGGNNSDDSSEGCCKLQLACNYRDGGSTSTDPQLQFC